jgi:hypothetical protein
MTQHSSSSRSSSSSSDNKSAFSSTIRLVSQRIAQVRSFTTALLLLYYCFAVPASPSPPSASSPNALPRCALYYCFTAALLLLYCACMTSAIRLVSQRIAQVCTLLALLVQKYKY